MVFLAGKTTRKLEEKIEHLEDYIKELDKENGDLIYMNRQLKEKLDKIEGGQQDKAPELFS